MLTQMNDTAKYAAVATTGKAFTTTSSETLVEEREMSPMNSAMLEQFRRYQRSKSVTLRDTLVQNNLPLVYSIARRYVNAAEPLDDLIQEGSIGLLKAIDGFDPDRGMCFSTYAYHLINRHITHYLRDYGYLIRQPARKQELNHRIARTTERLSHSLGRTPRPVEIAEELDLPVETVEQAQENRKLNDLVSLTAPSSDDDAGGQLIDRTPQHQRWARRTSLPIEDRIVLEEAISRLNGMEQRVLRLYYFFSLTLAEIAGRVNMTLPRVAYILRCAVSKIKTDLEV